MILRLLLIPVNAIGKKKCLSYTAPSVLLMQLLLIELFPILTITENVTKTTSKMNSSSVSY